MEARLLDRVRTSLSLQIHDITFCVLIDTFLVPNSCKCGPKGDLLYVRVTCRLSHSCVNSKLSKIEVRTLASKGYFQSYWFLNKIS